MRSRFARKAVKGIAKGCAIENTRPHTPQKIRREQTLTAIAREKPNIAQLDCRGLGRHLETPTPFLHKFAGPSKRECDLRIGEPSSRLHIHHDRTGVPNQEVVRNVLAQLPLDASSQQKWLGNEMLHTGVEIGKKQPGQLKSRLIDDVTADGTRPVRPRVVLLASIPPKGPPRHGGREFVDPGRRPLARDFAQIIRPPIGDGDR